MSELTRREGEELFRDLAGENEKDAESLFPKTLKFIREAPIEELTEAMTKAGFEIRDKRDAAADLEAVRTGSLLDSIVLGNDALPYWIREAQAQKERAERAEKEREAVIKLVLDNYSFCPVNVVCLGENGPSCRECLEADIRKRLAQEVGKDG